MSQQDIDPRKVRIGLAIVVAVVVAALAIMTQVDSNVARAVMAGVALLGIVRASLLYRSIRNERASGEPL